MAARNGTPIFYCARVAISVHLSFQKYFGANLLAEVQTAIQKAKFSDRLTGWYGQYTIACTQHRNGCVMANRKCSLMQSVAELFPSWIREADFAVWPIAAICACFFMTESVAHAQSAGSSAFSRQQIIQIAAQMQKESQKANTNDALERHLDSSTILAVRTKDGRAEFHTTSADVFFVIQGHATLVTGGTITNAHGTGEIRGDTIRGGTRTAINVGDVVHIPPKTPHQLLLNGSHEFVYVLVKLPAS